MIGCIPVARASAAVMSVTDEVERDDCDAEIKVLMPSFVPVLLDPYDTVAQDVLGKEKALVLWRAFKKVKPVAMLFALMGQLCQIFGAVVFSQAWHLALNSSFSTTVLCIGSLAPLVLILFTSKWGFKRILLQTFESQYLSFNIALMCFGIWTTCVEANVGIVLFMSCNLLLTIFLDGMPISVRKSSFLVFILGFAALEGALLVVMVWTSPETARLYSDSAIPPVHIPMLGYVSVTQRTVITPTMTLTLFCFKNMVLKKLNRKETCVILCTSVKEHRFQSKAALKQALQEKNDELLVMLEQYVAKKIRGIRRNAAPASSFQSVAPRRDSSPTNSLTIQVVVAGFTPVIYETEHTLAAALFGRKSADTLFSFYRHRACGAICFMISLIGSAITIPILTGFMHRELALLYIPATFPYVFGFLFVNLTKLGLVLRSFITLYLLLMTVILCGGFCLAFRMDVRALIAVFVAPSLSLVCTIDAQHRAVKKDAALHLLMACVSFASLLVVLFLGLGHDLYVIEVVRNPDIQVNLRTTSLQMFVLTPILAMLPFLTMCAFKYWRSSKSYVSIKSRLDISLFRLTSGTTYPCERTSILKSIQTRLIINVDRFDESHETRIGPVRFEKLKKSDSATIAPLSP